MVLATYENFDWYFNMTSDTRQPPRVANTWQDVGC